MKPQNWRMGALLALALAPGIFAVSYYVWKSLRPPPPSPAVAPVVRSAAAAKAEAKCGPNTTNNQHPGMVWVEAGTFDMGSAGGETLGFPEESPAVRTKVSGFWIDQTEVTNAQFAKFVAATGYRTLAERGINTTAAAGSPTVAGSAIFSPKGDAMALRSFVNWWQFKEGADWQHPEGPESNIANRMNHPVVHVAYEDAMAYATWVGRSLPTEAQFEFAAQSSSRKNDEGKITANTWQGGFPDRNTADDGYVGTAPVACYEANKVGVHDLIGNVWEWTSSPYYDRHESPLAANFPDGFDPNQPEEKSVAVIKGGSYLCSLDYCMRFRPEARIGQSKGLGTAHIGFRTVENVAAPQPAD